MLDTPCSEVECKTAGYPLHSHVSRSLPLPCVTVCHQVSTELYYSGVQNAVFSCTVSHSWEWNTAHQARQCTHNVTLRSVRMSNATVYKQSVFNIVCVRILVLVVMHTNPIFSAPYHIAICGLSCSTPTHKWNGFRKKKKSYWTQNVFCISHPNGKMQTVCQTKSMRRVSGVRVRKYGCITQHSEPNGNRTIHSRRMRRIMHVARTRRHTWYVHKIMGRAKDWKKITGLDSPG